jgi:hypothetical protein
MNRLKNHLMKGALNLETELIDHPDDAKKIYKYICPECKYEVILKKGNIKAHHFAHKTIKTCNYYTPSTETDLHIQAKYRMKHKLLKKYPITIYRECYGCGFEEDFNIEYTSTTIPEVEYKFHIDNCNNYKSADVALIDIDLNEKNGKKIKYIFEIFNTHKTDEINRCGIWFDLSAENIINTPIHNNRYRCWRPVSDCKYCEKKREEKRLRRIREEQEIEQRRIREEQLRILKEQKAEQERIHFLELERLRRIQEQKRNKLIELQQIKHILLKTESDKIKSCKKTFNDYQQNTKKYFEDFKLRHIDLYNQIEELAEEFKT